MKRAFATLLLLCGLTSPLTVLAYGPNIVGEFGVLKWALPVVLDEEADVLKECPPGSGQVDVSVANLLADAVTIWEAAPQTNLTTTIRSGLVPGIDGTNACDFLFSQTICSQVGQNALGPKSGGTNPIVYDEDGAIVSQFFGPGNRFLVLGFAGIVTFNDVADASAREALKGEAIINLACLQGCEEAGCSNGLNLSFDRDTEVFGFVLHEIGHFFGLNHTQVNLANDLAKLDPANTPTMWALFSSELANSILTLERDDEVGIAALYSDGSLASDFCTVTGTIKDEQGEEFQCANVVARNLSNMHGDAMSFVSGGDLPGGTSQVGRGRFTIRGLSPGANYRIEVEPLSRAPELSSPASGIIPCNGGDGNPTPPTFDEQVLAGTVSCLGGEIVDVGDVVLQNTSKNVGVGADPTPQPTPAGGCSLRSLTPAHP